MTVRELIRSFDAAVPRDVRVNGRRLQDLGREIGPGDRVMWTSRGLGWDIEIPAGAKSLAPVPA